MAKKKKAKKTAKKKTAKRKKRQSFYNKNPALCLVAKKKQKHKARGFCILPRPPS